MISSQILNFSAPIDRWGNESLTLSANIKTVLKETEEPIKFVRIKAKSDNTGKIHIGSKDVTSDNSTIELYAGDHIEIAINNLNKIYRH